MPQETKQSRIWKWLLCKVLPVCRSSGHAIRRVLKWQVRTGFWSRAWVAQSIKPLTWAQVMISSFVGLSPASGSVVTARSQSLLWILCLPLSLPLPNSHSVSQKQINIKKTKELVSGLAKLRQLAIHRIGKMSEINFNDRILSIQKWGNWGTKSLSGLSKAAQLVAAEARSEFGTQSQIVQYPFH